MLASESVVVVSSATTSAAALSALCVFAVCTLISSSGLVNQSQRFAEHLASVTALSKT